MVNSADTKLILLINVKMPTFVGILTFISRTNYRLWQSQPEISTKFCYFSKYQRTIGPENAHLKPDLGVLSHNEMTLTLNTHTPLLTS